MHLLVVAQFLEAVAARRLGRMEQAGIVVVIDPYLCVCVCVYGAGAEIETRPRPCVVLWCGVCLVYVVWSGLWCVWGGRV